MIERTVPLRERVQLVRELMAEGLSTDEIVRVLGGGPVAKAAMRAALADSRYTGLDEMGQEVIRHVYGVIDTNLLALALGRSVGALRAWVHRHGLTGVGRGGGKGACRCPKCQSRMMMVGFPIAHAGDGIGWVEWGVKCVRCELEVLYRLEWREVSADALQEHEGSAPEPEEVKRSEVDPEPDQRDSQVCGLFDSRGQAEQ